LQDPARGTVPAARDVRRTADVTLPL
jgi:hypothetical protein